MSMVSGPDPRRLAELLTADRLTSYTAVTGSLNTALALYDWNVDACAAVLSTTAMVEVIVRNAMDEQLVAWARRRQHSDWLAEVQLDAAGRRDLAEANRRATRQASDPPHGKVIAELNFGFWRYLAANRYLTSLWIPALQHAFPHGPEDPRGRQRSVDAALGQLVFVRNRAAHHEPIHRRSLTRDLDVAIDLAGMVDPAAAIWVAGRSTIPATAARRPEPGSS